MTPLDRAIRQITQVLESQHVEYAIVGGIANAVWGEPRATVDVDVTVAIEDKDQRAFVLAVAAQFTTPITETVTFVEQTRVLPLDTADGVRIDLIFALLPFELAAIRRARKVTLAERAVAVVTPEDLILMKIISDRPRDVADAEAIVRRRAADLDRAYLEPRVRELAVALERDDILERWLRWSSV